MKLIRSFSWHLICSVFTRHTISRRKQPSLLVRATENKMSVWRMETSDVPLSTPYRVACYIDRKNTPAWYGKKNRYSHCYKEWHSNLSDMWRFTFKIGTAQSSFVTEMYEKSSIGYGFGAGPTAIRYSIDIALVHWDKRSWLRKKRMQSHRVDTILPPFYVFGTTIWPTCRHVNNHKLFLRLTAIKT